MNELPTMQTQPRYLSTAETATLIRAALKKAFPGQKFSVRSSNYSGGSSVDVSYTDGPTQEAVEKVAGAYAGARFDGMIDLAYCAEHWYCSEHGAQVARTYGHSYEANGGAVGNGLGASRCCARAELVHMGAGYAPVSRQLSPEFREELRLQVCREDGLPRDASEDTPLSTNSCYAHGPYDTVRDAIYRLSVRTAR